MGILNIPQVRVESDQGGAGLHLLTSLLSHYLQSAEVEKNRAVDRAAREGEAETARTELEKWLTSQQPQEEITMPTKLERPAPAALAAPKPEASSQDIISGIAPSLPTATGQLAPELTKLLEGEAPNQVPEPEIKRTLAPPVPVTLPAKQAPGVYQAAAIAGINKSGLGKEPPVQLITDEQGNQRFVPKVEGATGYKKPEDYIVKPEVRKDPDGREHVMNVWYDKHNLNAPGVERGETRDPLATAMARAEAFAKAKPFPTLDAYNNFTPAVLTWGEADAANKRAREAGQPDRYVPVGPTQTSLTQMSLVADMQRTIDRVRETLPGAKFDAAAAGQASEMLRSINDKEAFGRLIQYAVGKTLTPGQADYLIALAQLQENSLALRSVLKAGPGSDQLREKILATLPSGSSPDLNYAMKQVDQYEAMLGALGKGIPGNVPGATIRGMSGLPPLPMRGANEPGIAAPASAPTATAPGGKPVVKTTEKTFTPAF